MLKVNGERLPSDDELDHRMKLISIIRHGFRVPLTQSTVARAYEIHCKYSLR